MKYCCDKFLDEQKDKKCIRKNDNKEFNLPRRFTRKRCKRGVNGFTMRSSCSPFKNCMKGGKRKTKKKQFFFNPNDPKNSFDVYIDKNPNDTIPIKYTTVEDVKNTIRKLEKLYKSKKYTHKRIFQVAMILKVRLRVLKNKKQEHLKIASKYYEFIKLRTKQKGKTKEETFKLRKKMYFVF